MIKEIFILTQVASDKLSWLRVLPVFLTPENVGAFVRQKTYTVADDYSMRRLYYPVNRAAPLLSSVYTARKSRSIIMSTTRSLSMTGENSYHPMECMSFLSSEPACRHFEVRYRLPLKAMNYMALPAPVVCKVPLEYSTILTLRRSNWSVRDKARPEWPLCSGFWIFPPIYHLVFYSHALNIWQHFLPIGKILLLLISKS